MRTTAPAGAQPGASVISRVKVLNRDSAEGLADWELSVSYYDTKGRVILSRFQNATKSSTTQGTGYNSIRYDFMDRPLITRSSNTNTAANKTAEEYYKYEYYTGSSRLYRSWHRAKTTDIWQVMQKLSYDDLGRISREVLGAGGEVRDYKYNLRGQLESINAPMPTPATRKASRGPSGKYWNTSIPAIP
ncbi:hypothetical protein LWM68_20225 [Niabella sp. W65]|nr:hypothetical protein [Niabella sp. W65]MCH7364883.1 hypothetical protein [Niabella sp. W65]